MQKSKQKGRSLFDPIPSLRGNSGSINSASSIPEESKAAKAEKAKKVKVVAVGHKEQQF